jgi:hypothetical protein
MTIMEQISNEVRSIESGTLDPALRTKILAHIATEAVPDAAPEPPVRTNAAKPRFRLQLAEYGALAIVVIVVGAVIYPTTYRARENARRGVSSSTVRSLPDLAPGAQYDSASTPASPGSAPVGGPVADGGAGAANDALASRIGPSAGDLVETRLADNAVTARGKLSKDRATERPRLAAEAAQRRVPSSVYPGSAASMLPSTLRRVHKEARIAVEVKKLEEQSDAVESMVKSAGGFVVSNTLSTSGNGAKTAALDIKVPVKQFETILKQIGDLGEVKAKNVSGQDLTEQVSDAQAADNVLSSELSVKEAMLKEARLKAAKKKNVVLNDWQQRAEVRRLRIEAAQVRARLELLRRTSELSNISVQLQEQPILPGQGGFLEGISETGHDAFESFLVAARLPINLLIWILAYSPLWIPLLIAYHYMLRVYRRTPPP